MKSDTLDRLVIADLRGGRNGTDPPMSLADQHCVEAFNVDWYGGATFARRRNGCVALAMTSAPFTGKVSWMGRHVPSTDETAAELWGMDDAATPLIGRLAGGTSWSTPTLKDVPTGNGWDMTSASLNATFFLAYQSGQARLHVWDGSTVRRAGITMPPVPVPVDNGGAGTYPAVQRYVRYRYAVQSAGITLRRSEPSAGVAFTPSGGALSWGAAAPTALNEQETHYEIEVSLDNATYYVLQTVAIASSWASSVLTTAYGALTVSAVIGTYTIQKPYRFIAADQGRVLGFGSYTSTDKQDTIEYSAVVGDLNVSDAERVPVGNTITLDENDSGVPTGLVGPVNGAFYAFKYRQVWKLTPTGSSPPYSKLAISKTIGAVGPQAIKVGEDEAGRPCLYWMSHRGPYRYSVYGLEYVGHNVEDKTQGINSGTTLNLAATKVVSHLQWHGDKRQMWCWIATGANNDPDTILKLSVGHVQSATAQPVPDAWSVDVGPAARCSVMFSNTVGATMSRDLKPYFGLAGTNDTISKADTGNQDNGANYQSYVLTKLYPEDLGALMAVEKVGIIAATSAATVTCTTVNGSGLSSNSDTVDLTAAGSETRVLRPFGSGVQTATAPWVQFQIGDGSAQNVTWQIDAILVARTEGSAII